MKASLIPTTQHDRDSAEATKRLVNQGYRAAQLVLQVQPMLHHPTATSATAFLPRASVTVSSCMTGRFAMRIEVSSGMSKEVFWVLMSFFVSFRKRGVKFPRPPDSRAWGAVRQRLE